MSTISNSLLMMALSSKTLSNAGVKTAHAALCYGVVKISGVLGPPEENERVFSECFNAAKADYPEEVEAAIQYLEAALTRLKQG